MRYDNLPIYKAALDLCVYVELIVKGFDKYHKYTLGVDLRNYSKELLFMIHRANISHSKFAGHCSHANSYNLVKKNRSFK